MNSFFDDKIPSAYCVSIISFDDDYYYGQLYRYYEGGFKRLLCNFKLDLDDDVALVTLDDTGFIDQQILDDFEVGYGKTYEDGALGFQEVFENKLRENSSAIFKILKEEGGTFHSYVAFIVTS